MMSRTRNKRTRARSADLKTPEKGRFSYEDRSDKAEADRNTGNDAHRGTRRRGRSLTARPLDRKKKTNQKIEDSPQQAKPRRERSRTRSRSRVGRGKIEEKEIEATTIKTPKQTSIKEMFNKAKQSTSEPKPKRPTPPSNSPEKSRQQKKGTKRGKGGVEQLPT